MNPWTAGLALLALLIGLILFSAGVLWTFAAGIGTEPGTKPDRTGLGLLILGVAVTAASIGVMTA